MLDPVSATIIVGGATVAATVAVGVGTIAVSTVAAGAAVKTVIDKSKARREQKKQNGSNQHAMSGYPTYVSSKHSTW